MGICPYKKKNGTLMQLKKVRVRLVAREEHAQWNGLMEEHHYLANGTMVGPQLRYVAEIGNKAVALIGFSNASLHLRARDHWIGWNDIQRDRRLGFIAQNSRFLVLPDAHVKNMASRVLSLCTQRIQQDWLDAFGQPLLLLETFTELDGKRRGTGYRAAGWQRVGETSGYSRDRNKFYTKTSAGKAVWCKELDQDACGMLSASAMPAALACHEKAVTAEFCSRKLGPERLDSLFNTLRELDEPSRRKGQRYLRSSCLAVLFCGIFAGCKGVRECVELVSSFSQSQLKALRLWRDPRTKRYKVPSHVTLWRAVAGTNPEEFEQRVLNWFNASMGGGIELIHIDGKALRATLDADQKGTFLVSAASFGAKKFSANLDHG